MSKNSTVVTSSVVVKKKQTNTNPKGNPPKGNPPKGNPPKGLGSLADKLIKLGFDVPKQVNNKPKGKPNQNKCGQARHKPKPQQTKPPLFNYTQNKHTVKIVLELPNKGNNDLYVLYVLDNKTNDITSKHISFKTNIKQQIMQSIYSYLIRRYKLQKIQYSKCGKLYQWFVIDYRTIGQVKKDLTSTLFKLNKNLTS